MGFTPPDVQVIPRTYDGTGRAVEYGSHIYRASRYTFELTLTSG